MADPLVTKHTLCVREIKKHVVTAVNKNAPVPVWGFHFALVLFHYQP